MIGGQPQNSTHSATGSLNMKIVVTKSIKSIMNFFGYTGIHREAEFGVDAG
jgi:hypothetical protein